MPIIYKTGSLFSAPTGSILVHACNAQGVWGSGIAVEFKKRFPLGYKDYNEFCFCVNNVENQTIGIAGSAIVTKEENGYQVGCLITSENYGGLVDKPEIILENTKLALDNLHYYSNSPVYHSNKFNSGLFGVPWEDTEAVILEFLEQNPTVTWNVWSID